MQEEQVELGQNYQCQPVGFENIVVGEVVSKMANCAVIRVNSCETTDAQQLEAKSNMVVARYDTFTHAR
ncbi:hypothetical protein IGI37_001538 [Enterococcus sp. AZ194]|uniref:hypothetical protein n=1 Tax=Enterococcus sp. AZ194 TaxID=2774629 RepID=UPI003F213D99